VFYTAADRSAYLRLVSANLGDAGVRVLAWCLMTNHIHFVAVPERSDSLAVLLRRVHGRYAQMVNARRLRTGHLWQNRFYSCPLAPSHLWRALVYVERNPVRAGLAERPEQYRWSSAAAHLGLAKDGIGLLDQDFWEEQGGAAGWRELLFSPEEAMDLRLLRRCTYAGRPYGDEGFVALFEERFQRKWRRWGFEDECQVRTFAS
jgi:putative transposase